MTQSSLAQNDIMHAAGDFFSFLELLSSYIRFKVCSIYNVLQIDQFLLSFMNYWWITILLIISLIILFYWKYSRNTQKAKRLSTSVKSVIEHQSPSPPGFKLRHRLQSHPKEFRQIIWSPDGKMLASVGDPIRLWDPKTGQDFQRFGEYFHSLAWSPDGQLLASGSYDNIIQIWDTKTWQRLHKLTAFSNGVLNMTWSPSGRILASCSSGYIIQIWDAKTWQVLRILQKEKDYETISTVRDDKAWDYEQEQRFRGPTSPSTVPAIAWSLDGRTLASGFHDETIQTWNAETWERLWKFTLKPSNVAQRESGYNSVAWSPDGQFLAAGFSDNTIWLLDSQTGQEVGTLEGQTSEVHCISFSPDGSLIASKSLDETIHLWRSDTWETVAAFKEDSSIGEVGLVFHPIDPILATFGKGGSVIHLWDLDMATLLKGSLTSLPVRYTNAKVVLVGDSGVGKSGLGLVLSQQPFAPTESTHGRHVWVFDSQAVKLPNNRMETHETLLWDLAGQPGYRLIHQLHLNEVTVALIVFDAHSETNPFAGVQHWNRALNVAQCTQSNSPLSLKKLLIAARIDRGGSSVSHARVDSLIQELCFDGYFETSAKENKGIEDLKKAIREAINWETLPWVSSTLLFQSIKDFLVSEKEAGRLLSSVEDLYHSFLRIKRTHPDTGNLQDQFKTCIGRVESRGLIRRLSFGNLVLLQPELLDAYASALVNAVKDEPDELGSITEERVRIGDFFIPEDERLKDRDQEKILLIAMVEDLLRHEIALREPANDGSYLIFPSQSTRENPDLPDPEGKAVVFSFEGSVLNIYATLAVRLSHSGLFKKKEIWKNAITYTTNAGGTYGIYLHNTGEGQGKLILFFDKTASEETCFHFEEFIQAHLKRRGLPESIRRHRVFICNNCSTVMTEQIVQSRLERNFDWLNCPVCDGRVLLLDREERFKIVPSSAIREMDRAADNQRDNETIQSILQGKIETKDFDVFLCHNSSDKRAVKKIGERLKEYGILPWLDEWELRPGLPWQSLLEERINQIKSAAVFVGKNGRGPWQDMELYAFLRKFVKRQQKCPVIPVILPDCNNIPELPTFLESMTWVDFRKRDPDPMEMLIWGITGKRTMIR
jgi:WD40 repeat protein